MAWNNVKTWAQRELLKAADLNTYVRDNLAYLKSVVDAIDLGDYLPVAGGTMTGDLDMDSNDLIDAVVTNAVDKVHTANVSGAVTIDAANGGTQILTLTGNVTSITVANLPSGGSIDVLWQQDATGSRTTAWPAAWYWVVSEAAATGAIATGASAINMFTIKRWGSIYTALFAGNLTT